MRLDHMHLRHMRMIVMAADGKTVGQVAKAMAVTSPCVSIAINRCEEMLGIQLFRRGGPQNRMTGINPKAIDVIDRMRAILMMADADPETIWQAVTGTARPWVPVAQVTKLEAA